MRARPGVRKQGQRELHKDHQQVETTARRVRGREHGFPFREAGRTLMGSAGEQGL